MKNYESISPFIIFIRFKQEEDGSEKEEYEKFKKVSFFNYLTIFQKENESAEELSKRIASNIRSKLYQIDSYFNERGFLSLHF